MKAMDAVPEKEPTFFAAFHCVEMDVIKINNLPDRKCRPRHPQNRQKNMRVSSCIALKVIEPSKLVILKTRPLPSRFKPFHFRVQDP